MKTNTKIQSDLERLEQICWFNIGAMCGEESRLSSISRRFKRMQEEMLLGEILVQQDLLTVADFLAAVEESRAREQRLEHVLVASKRVPLKWMMIALDQRRDLRHDLGEPDQEER